MTAALSLPVLDLQPYRDDPASPEALAFVDELRHVVHEIGFFYVVGHGVPTACSTRVPRRRRGVLRPRRRVDRLEIENVRSPQFRGYTRFGHEHTNGRVDLRDQIDIGRELPPPVARRPTTRPGCACAGRTCGRRRCRSSARS